MIFYYRKIEYINLKFIIQKIILLRLIKIAADCIILNVFIKYFWRLDSRNQKNKNCYIKISIKAH